MLTFKISVEGESKSKRSKVQDKLRGAGKENNNGSMNFLFEGPK